MTTKSQVTSTTSKPKGEVLNLNGKNLNTKNINSIGQFINAGLIDLSPINYRRHINADSLEELAESIRQEGILQAILVRPKGKRYEVVVGERRFRAAGLSTLVRIPCIVEELTDEQVRGKQLIENLQREEPNIFDLAKGFAELQTAENLTVAALARRVGKTETFVTEVLRLNDVIEEAANDYDAGFLPFDLLIEVAKYPQESQADVLRLCYTDIWTPNGYVANKEGSPRKLADVRKAAEQKVMLNLKHAPFKLDAENLHPEGLSCTNCTQRTDMNGVLFAAHAKIGNCLNAACFQGKMQTFINIKREKIAQERTDKNARDFAKAQKAEKKSAVAVEAVEKVEAVDAAEGAEKPSEQPTAKIVTPSEVPLLNLGYGSGNHEKNILGYGAYREIGKNDTVCEFAEKAVIIASHRFGAQTKICRQQGCSIHFPNSSSSSNSSVSSSSSQTQDNGKRRQELFDCKIVEPLRLQVFDEAKNAFDADAWAFDNPRWRLLMIFHIYRNEEYKRRTRALELSGIADNEMPSTSERDDEEIVAQLEKVDAGKLSKLLFLLLVMYRGEQPNFSKSLPDMSGVKSVAADFNINYRLMDAKLRVEKAPKCHLPKAKAYLGKVEAGDTKTPTPNFYAPAVEETVKEVKAKAEAKVKETPTVEATAEATTPTEAGAKPAAKLTLVKSDKTPATAVEGKTADEQAATAAEAPATVKATTGKLSKRTRTATTEKLAA